jgi:quinohemoprotein ethanol dehydrogenase
MFKQFCVFLLAGFFGIAAAQAATAELGTGANWPSNGGGTDDSGYSRLHEIDSKNIEKLGLASYLDLPIDRSLEATPLAVDGVLYFTSSYSAVYAVDAASSKLLWKYDAFDRKNTTPKSRTSLPINRGAAYADGRVFFCALDGRVIALEAKTGKMIWTAESIALEARQSCTGAPRVFKGKVLIGNGGASFGVRGYVTAFDAVTGKQLWRFYTVPGSPEENKGDATQEMAAKTWGGEYWKYGGGGTAWDGLTYDPELNRVYVGTGNAGPYDPELRAPGGGDTLFISSIVALDPDTGKYIWHYQENPREAWDYKSTPNIIAATIKFDGKLRKVLLHAPTNGFLYMIDRETGKVITAGKTGKVTWAEGIDLKTGRPIEAPNIRFETGESTLWPGMLGGHNWQPMSFNPQTGLVYIPYMQLGTKFMRLAPGEKNFHNVKYTDAVADENDGKGALIAMDPITQQLRWKVQHPGMWNGGTMTTAGNLVFQGTADGYFDAYDATTGKRLWRFNAGLGIIARPISYAVGGKQYVSVLVGWGGSAASGSPLLNMGWKYNAQPRRLLTFQLGGKTVLPPSAPPDLKVYAVDKPELKLDPADVAAGKKLATQCIGCHGLELQSAGSPGPDLRESPQALELDSLWAVLHDGALMENGMPRFESFTRDEVRQIYTYIRSRARDAIKAHKQAQPSG